MKMVIADDEPLVQIGLKSMVSWEELGIEICGVASNGDKAYELIEQYRPDIVITDIRMPCSSGLELAGKCRERFGRVPVFIILTSYEDFTYAREALKFQVVDYLVKIDLSPESLTESVKKAKEQVELFRRQRQPEPADASNLALFQERFYLCLLNNLFENREETMKKAQELRISFAYDGYAVAGMEFDAGISGDMRPGESMKSYHQALQMFRELIVKYIPCRVIPLDTRMAAVIFGVDGKHIGDWREYLENSLRRTLAMLHSYYHASFQVCIGRMVDELIDVSVSYYDARQIAGYVSKENALIFWDDFADAGTLRNVFNLYIFRKELIRVFEEKDEEALHDTLQDIIGLLSAEQIHFSQALDVASSLLHLTIHLLDDGNRIAAGIFCEEEDTFRSLYRMKSTGDVVKWLERLERGLARVFADNRKEHTNYLVSGCCEYIERHIQEKISLAELADAFKVSPNYLSQLFKRHMEMGLNEYITNQKIIKSRHLLRETNMRIYEIAESLGFENAFYFSKVFKKTVGLSPKDYRNSK